MGCCILGALVISQFILAFETFRRFRVWILASLAAVGIGTLAGVALLSSGKSHSIMLAGSRYCGEVTEAASPRLVPRVADKAKD